MSAPLTPKPDAAKNRPGASRLAAFAVALFYMFLGAVLGMIAARAVSGNPMAGGPHGGGWHCFFLFSQLRFWGKP